MSFYDITVVLVRSLYDSNIGATSRAMSNMGLEKLILIDPKCEITYAAQQAAASGQAALQNRIVYSDWQDFFNKQPNGIRIAFSARDGRGRPLWDFSERLKWLKNNVDSKQPLYLIFGPEDWGLSAQDLDLVHYNCNIPTWGQNSSLNLAQAVLLALFIFRSELGGSTRTVLDGQQPDRLQLQAELDSKKIFPQETLRIWLEEMGFDVSSKRTNVYSVLKRMLLHNVPTEKELNILETVLQQSIRKLREWKTFSKSKARTESLKASHPYEPN